MWGGEEKIFFTMALWSRYQRSDCAISWIGSDRYTVVWLIIWYVEVEWIRLLTVPVQICSPKVQSGGKGGGASHLTGLVLLPYGWIGAGCVLF